MPEIDEEKLLSVASEVFGDETEFYKTHCIKPLLDYRNEVRVLDFPPNGITTYWSANCNHEVVGPVVNLLKDFKIDAYNQRVFKKVVNGKASYEIRFPSQQLDRDEDTTYEKLINKTEKRDGAKFRFTRGDYSLVKAI